MKRLLLASAALGALGWTSGAKAQLIVSDPFTEVNTLNSWYDTITTNVHEVTEIENQTTQIVQLATTIAAIAHGNYYAITALAPQLAQTGLIDPLNTDAVSLAQAFGGLGIATGQLVGSASQFLAQTGIYMPGGSDYRALEDVQVATGLANQLAAATTLGNANQARMLALPAIAATAANAADIKEATDATARLAGETAEGVAQGNQIAALRLMQETQKQANDARDEQMWRCSADQLVTDAQNAAAAAGAGTVTLATAPGSNLGCAMTAASTGGVSISGLGTTGAGTTTAGTGTGLDGAGVSVPGDDTGASTTDPSATATGTGGDITTAAMPVSAVGDDGGALSTMEAQSWGTQAAANATALGVNPSALAATCQIESNCTASVGGTGTITGAFQMTAATEAADLNTAVSNNPSLAPQITSNSSPVTQSVAASQDLLSAANTLQSAGVSDPTVLDARGFYQFGAGAGPTIAQASDSATMASVCSCSAATLAANNISSTKTVGTWRQGVTNTLGAAATQPILLPQQVASN